MQSRHFGFVASRLALAMSLAFVGVGGWAAETKAEDHSAHHPAGGASAAKSAAKPASKATTKPEPAKALPAETPPAAPDKGNAEKMGQMDTHMKVMKELHQKFMAAKTAEERKALMPEHMKAMQDAMATMETPPATGGTGASGGMGGMGMMGGADKAAMMDKMSHGMMAKHKMMEKRMDMMQTMMQMMMDRMQVPTTP